MLWIKTAVALFIGGYVGTVLGVEYHYPILMCMILGSLIGGLLYRPIQVLKALKQAVTEVTKWNYRKIFEITAFVMQSVFGVIFFAFSLVAGMFISVKITSVFIDFFNISIENTPIDFLIAYYVETLAVTIAIILQSANSPLDGPLSNKYGIRIFDKFMRITNPGKGYALAGILVLATATIGHIPLALGILYLCGLFMKLLIEDLPEIFFLFTKLIATQARLVVMASCATGVAIGSSYGHAILGGGSAVVIGILVTYMSKLTITHWKPVKAK